MYLSIIVCVFIGVYGTTVYVNSDPVFVFAASLPSTHSNIMFLFVGSVLLGWNTGMDY